MATELISPLGADSLDLDIIKSTYKQYIKDNSTITDVDVEGSNISILIDIMSYINKNINSTIALNANQTTLLLSTVRQNIIYQAQGLSGYNITRPISSKMNITLSATLGVSESVSIPAWTEFTCGDYTFYNTELVSLSDTTPSKTITIVEGLFIDYNTDTSLRTIVSEDTTDILLPYSNIENDNVFYRVKKDGLDYYSDYTKTDYITNLSDNELLFKEDLEPETSYLYIRNSFGGNGNKLILNDTYDISFLLSSGTSANGVLVCDGLSLTSNLSNLIDISITVNSPSSGGSDTESNESIKRNAPLFNNTGLRTVTSVDYESFLELSSLVETASAWGGETMYPANLGHIYMSCIPQDTSSKFLTSLEEVNLLQFVRPIIGTGRIFKHPNYLLVDYRIQILGDVIFNIEDKKTQINTALEEYFALEFNKYKTSFFTNKTIAVIDDFFINEKDASIYVQVLPKIELSKELFEQNSNPEIYIPNSSKRNYLIKGSDRIDVPDNQEDINSYLLNGWTIETDYDIDLGITFSGIINSKTITEGTITNGTINGGTYDYKVIYLDGVEIGNFNINLNILNLEDIRTDLVNTSEYINISYSPEMNVITEKSTVIKLGTITYI